MAWHDLNVLLVQLYPEEWAPYTLNDVLAILRDGWPELRPRLTYSRVYKTYRGLRDNPATCAIVAPIDPAEQLKHFQAHSARRIAARAVGRKLPANIRKVNAFEAEIEAQKQKLAADWKRTGSGLDVAVVTARSRDKIVLSSSGAVGLSPAPKRQPSRP